MECAWPKASEMFFSPKLPNHSAQYKLHLFSFIDVLVQPPVTVCLHFFSFFSTKSILPPTCKWSPAMLVVLGVTVGSEPSEKCSFSVSLIACLLGIHTDSFW